jgi:hypothetical protein
MRDFMRTQLTDFAAEFMAEDNLDNPRRQIILTLNCQSKWV